MAKAQHMGMVLGAADDERPEGQPSCCFRMGTDYDNPVKKLVYCGSY